MNNAITQRLNAWSTDRKKYERINPGVNTYASRIRSMVYLKTIPIKKSGGKTMQLSSLIQRAKVIDKGYGNFFYSLDEKCVPLLSGKVIDNMPIDYSVIVESSLADLRKKNEDTVNNISKQNLRVLDIVEKYLRFLLPQINKNIAKECLESILSRRAESLEEALQRILFVNQLLWQSKHTLVGLGRIDKILNRFEIDDRSKTIIMDFMRTLHEFYNYKSNSLMGDTGQIFILGGLEPDGNYFCNDYTYLFIECIKDLGLPDPKVLLRVSANMPEDLLKLATESIATGVGSPLLSNDDVVIPALLDFGYTEEDAFGYGTSACWEPLVIGKSLEQNNIASILYGRAAHDTCVDDAFTGCKSYDEVIEIFKKHLDNEIHIALETIDKIEWEYDPLVTLFTKGCLEKDLDISQGGTIYNNYGLLTEGMSSAVNSLLNIKRFCFKQEKVSLETVKNCIYSNFEGYSEEKELLSLNADGFGTDSEEAIELTNEILQYTIVQLKDYRNKFGGKVKFGLSSPNYVKNGLKVGATADGRLAYTPFATHISREKGDPITEIANFASGLRYEGINANANVVDVVIQPNLIVDNIDKFVQYLMAIIKKGVFQIQFNVLSYEKLVDAKAHPELYPDLIVRVWGFSAYFKDLPESYQDQLIKRAKEMERV
ncbi:MAG: pyruvate formate lyase family protein [Eubacteriales bacterium]|nr:pyruvate formate lyase family protein [Eubacteriales bacterium]